MKTISRLAAACAAASVAAGCASTANLTMMRQPPLPPVAVAKAAPAGPYYRNISIQSVEGAPEFVLLDGNGLINTRPTRKHMIEILNEDLANADMLAPSRLDGDLVLYVNVESLKGPDVVPFSHKLASARVTFRLVRWRTGAVVRQKTEEAVYVARFPGIAPETVRFVLGTTALGAIKGAEIGYVVAASDGNWDDTQIDWKELREDVATGAAYGAAAGAGTGIVLSLFDEGRIQPVGALKGAYLSDPGRIQYATNEVVHLLMDDFLHDLSKDGSVVFKHAVSCNYLNPDKFSYPVTETRDAVGIDCPGVHYTSDRLFDVGPSHFAPTAVSRSKGPTG